MSSIGGHSSSSGLDPVAAGRVLLKTSQGEIEIELWSTECPKASRNFIELCLEGYYNGCIIHRVVPGFIAQTGDASNTGKGGKSIYNGLFEDEFNEKLKFNRKGLVGMGNQGSKNSNLSQFFFTLEATPGLQNRNTLFGRVVDRTLANVLSLNDIELQPGTDRPTYPPIIESAIVLENPFGNSKTVFEPRKGYQAGSAIVMSEKSMGKRKEIDPSASIGASSQPKQSIIGRPSTPIIPNNSNAMLPIKSKREMEKIKYEQQMNTYVSFGVMIGRIRAIKMAAIAKANGSGSKSTPIIEAPDSATALRNRAIHRTDSRTIKGPFSFPRVIPPIKCPVPVPSTSSNLPTPPDEQLPVASTSLAKIMNSPHARAIVAIPVVDKPLENPIPVKVVATPIEVPTPVVIPTPPIIVPPPIATMAEAPVPVIEPVIPPVQESSKNPEPRLVPSDEDELATDESSTSNRKKVVEKKTRKMGVKKKSGLQKKKEPTVVDRQDSDMEQLIVPTAGLKRTASASSIASSGRRNSVAESVVSGSKIKATTDLSKKAVAPGASAPVLPPPRPVKRKVLGKKSVETPPVASTSKISSKFAPPPIASTSKGTEKVLPRVVPIKKGKVPAPLEFELEFEMIVISDDEESDPESESIRALPKPKKKKVASKDPPTVAKAPSVPTQEQPKPVVNQENKKRKRVIADTEDEEEERPEVKRKVTRLSLQNEKEAQEKAAIEKEEERVREKQRMKELKAQNSKTRFGKIIPISPPPAPPRKESSTSESSSSPPEKKVVPKKLVKSKAAAVPVKKPAPVEKVDSVKKVVTAVKSLANLVKKKSMPDLKKSTPAPPSKKATPAPTAKKATPAPVAKPALIKPVAKKAVTPAPANSAAGNAVKRKKSWIPQVRAVPESSKSSESIGVASQGKKGAKRAKKG